VVVVVWLRGVVLVVVNYYNPCQTLDLVALERVEGKDRKSDRNESSGVPE
jgi:hypothetical protein